MSKEARILFLTAFGLVGIGLVMIYSSSSILAAHRYGNPTHFLFRQLLYALLGTVGFFVAVSKPARFYKQHARVFILISIFLLMLLFLPVIGHSAGGARRWLRVAGFNFQPVEFVKIACCIYFADFLSRKNNMLRKGDYHVFVVPILLMGAICFLILIQPDLGSVAILCMIAGVLFFLAGVRMRYVVAALVVFLPALYFLIIRVPYRLHRLQAYINPWEDPKGKGFQIIQSLLSFALGGLEGVGLGKGTQKLFYLPASHNDFILSMIGEELGFFGATCVVILFAVFLICGMRIAMKKSSPFEMLTVASLVILVAMQALFHMMVTTGLVPTKGLPLPLVSYGGSSLVANLIIVGIIISFDKKSSLPH